MHLAVDRQGYQVKPNVETQQGWYPGDPRGKYHRLTVSTGIDAQLDHIVALRPAYLKAAAVHLGALALQSARAQARHHIRCRRSPAPRP